MPDVFGLNYMRRRPHQPIVASWLSWEGHPNTSPCPADR